jgi:hypothetical protein
MSTDIYTIVEIKKDNQWKYINDIPTIFNSRNYGIFSILNSCLRCGCNLDGFKPKGLPSDISILKCCFVSLTSELTKSYQTKESIFCVSDTQPDTYYNAYDKELTTEIDEKTYEAIVSDTISEKDRYLFPFKSANTNTYIVQDAKKVGGHFEKLVFCDKYKTLDEFNNDYYHYKWVEEEQNYGYYQIDFTSTDFYGHSYLNLEELKSKVQSIQGDEIYKVDKRFIDKLLSIIEELPEEFIIKENNDEETVTVLWTPNWDVANIYEEYEKGVKEIETLKEKYNIKSDEDIRIVFAFDC